MMSRKDNSLDTDNVLVGLGFDDVEEVWPKAALALKFNELIDKRGLSQTEAATITRMTQPKVSQISSRTFRLNG
jgi:predicted XRE-type DNA-binding protein